MRVALLSIGDELVIGQIINGNAAWISAAVTEIGGVVTEHAVIRDDAEMLRGTLDRLRMHADVLLLTGGLGPTHDDITKDVLTAYFGDHLIEHEPTRRMLEEWMQRRGRTLSERNAQQAMVPSTCEPLANPRGTAPGLLFERDGVLLVAMPGVPDEMKGLMREHVLPRMRARVAHEAQATWEYRMIHTSGIAESDLADVLGEPNTWLGDGTLAFLPNYHGVRLRLGVSAVHAHERLSRLDALESYVRDRAGRFVFGVGDVSMAAVVGRFLTARSETLSVAESCTGGLLGATCTDIPGSSAWFLGGVISYDNAVKIGQLGVDAAVLERDGAVSESVALQMASGVRDRLRTQWGIGITGVAGPDGGTPDKPVGTVWIAVATPTRTFAVRHAFGTDRVSNRQRSVAAALTLLFREVSGGS
jgi:nicotinamide-nucleotide amidase